MKVNKKKIHKHIKQYIIKNKLPNKEALLNHLDIIFDELLKEKLVLEKWRNDFHSAALSKYMETI